MLNEINKTINEYYKDLKEFIYGLKNTEDITVTLQGYPAYQGEHIEIAIYSTGEDNWSITNHKLFCEAFNVHLIDFQIHYTYQCNRLDSNNEFKYIYSSNDRLGIDYPRRMQYFEYDPFSINDYDKAGSSDTRMKTHTILKLLRELDNLGLDYEGYVDKSRLDLVIEQLECVLKYKEDIPKK